LIPAAWTAVLPGGIFTVTVWLAVTAFESDTEADNPMLMPSMSIPASAPMVVV
jgi:hypothetical protein